MGRYTAFGIAALLSASSFLLSGCASSATFFSAQSVGSSVHTKQGTYHPVLIPINAALFADKHVYQGMSSMRALWYSDDYAYRIGASDVLSITVWDHPELTTPTRLSTETVMNTGLVSNNNNTIPGILVNAKGDIFYPYAGDMHVQGLTVGQLRTTLAKRLARYIRKPQLNVRLAAFRSQTVQVLGAVKQQGVVPISDHPLTILDAVAQSGGVNAMTADTHHIFVIRGSGLKPYVFMLNADSPSSLLISQRFKLYNRDIVFVPQSGLANWNRFVSEVLPTLQTVAYTNSIVR